MSDYPRCPTCKWWHDGSVIFNADLKGWGRCVLAESSDAKPVHPHALMVARDLSSYVAMLDTHKTFGCVQHEPREDGA